MGMGSATLADIGFSVTPIVRDTDTPSGDVCPHGRASLLENGTEESQKPVRAITSVIASQCTEKRTTIRLGASRRRGSVTPGPALRSHRPARARALDGELDPGSGRTLAACLTHASRARSNWWQHQGRPSGERVSNT